MATQPASLVTEGTQHPVRTLVLGLGNPLVSDDSVGLRVVQELRAELAAYSDVEVDEEYCGGLRLMERLVGYDRAILIDAICAGHAPGTVRVFSPETATTRHSASAHDVSLVVALALGCQAGAALPRREAIRLVTIEAADVETFGEECTPAVADSVGRAADIVRELLATWRSGP
jgi:hydrogenase maturation protease